MILSCAMDYCKIIIYDNIKVEWNHFASLFKCLVIIDLTYAPGLLTLK